MEGISSSEYIWFGKHCSTGYLHMHDHKVLNRNVFKEKKSADNICCCVPPWIACRFNFFGEISPKCAFPSSQSFSPEIPRLPPTVPRPWREACCPEWALPNSPVGRENPREHQGHSDPRYSEWSFSLSWLEMQTLRPHPRPNETESAF